MYSLLLLKSEFATSTVIRDSYPDVSPEITTSQDGADDEALEHTIGPESNPANGEYLPAQTVTNERQRVTDIACAGPKYRPLGSMSQLRAGHRSCSMRWMGMREETPCVGDNRWRHRYHKMKARRYRCRDACGCSQKSKGHHDAGTGIAAAGVRGMRPHLLRTPHSPSRRRCPWTPGACPPRSQCTLSRKMAMMHTSPPCTRCNSSVRRTPCACLQDRQWRTRAKESAASPATDECRYGYLRGRKRAREIDAGVALR